MANSADAVSRLSPSFVDIRKGNLKRFTPDDRFYRHSKPSELVGKYITVLNGFSDFSNASRSAYLPLDRTHNLFDEILRQVPHQRHERNDNKPNCEDARYLNLYLSADADLQKQMETVESILKGMNLGSRLLCNYKLDERGQLQCEDEDRVV